MDVNFFEMRLKSGFLRKKMISFPSSESIPSKSFSLLTKSKCFKNFLLMPLMRAISEYLTKSGLSLRMF